MVPSNIRLPILNVGCGNAGGRFRVPAGVQFGEQINCDLYPGPNTDKVFDACEEWPFEDSSVGYIYASHILEHLPDWKKFFHEAHRVLAPNCTLFVAVPYANSQACWGDPTHIKAWNELTFCALQPGFAGPSHNPQHADWNAPFEVQIIGKRIEPRLGPYCKFPYWWAFGHMVDYMWNTVVELRVHLRALKTPEDVFRFTGSNPSNAVPVAHIIEEHDIEGRPLRKDEIPVVRVLQKYSTGFSDKPTGVSM